MNLESRSIGFPIIVACWLLLACCSSDSIAQTANARTTNQKTLVAPKAQLGKFFDKYCSDCHGYGADEGGLVLEQLGTDLGNAAVFSRWERIFDRVRNGEMPPEGEMQPTVAHRETFAKILRKPLVEAINRLRELFCVV